MKLSRTLIAGAVLALFGGLAQAADAGNIVLKVGVHNVNPKSDNGTLAGTLDSEVGSDAKPTIQAEYFLSPNLGIEVLAALPFTHDVKLNGVKAAEVSHLPPVVSLQYHFNPNGISPFVGIGLNYTTFFNIHEKGPIAGTHLGLESSWGLAAHVGVDFPVNDKWLIQVDARWADIDSTAKLNGAKIGTVNIDPLVYGVSVGYKF